MKLQDRASAPTSSITSRFVVSNTKSTVRPSMWITVSCTALLLDYGMKQLFQLIDCVGIENECIRVPVTHEIFGIY